MSAVEARELWSHLAVAGIAAGEMPEARAGATPWFVRVMLGIAGWIGALFLLGFVGAGFAFVMENALASVFVGALACAAAAIVFRTARESDFAAQFGLALSLAGQALLLFGLSRGFERSVASIALVAALQQALLFALVPNFIHRVWCAWTAGGALAIACTEWGLQSFVPAVLTLAFLWLWLSEFERAARAGRQRALGYGLALALAQFLVFNLGQWPGLMAAHGVGASLGRALGAWPGAVASVAVLIAGVLKLLAREGLTPNSTMGRFAIAAALILGLASLKAPGVGPAAAILVLGYANGNRVLTGLGIGTFVVYLALYYYQLQMTLLEKSALLAATGVALLALRFAAKLAWPNDDGMREETRHA